ncbi:unnamed protein product [Lampetra planeri]
MLPAPCHPPSRARESDRARESKRRESPSLRVERREQEPFHFLHKLTATPLPLSPGPAFARWAQGGGAGH